MARDLKALQRTTDTQHPPRVLIYGPPGLGKTSLAAEFPAPVLIDIEQGCPPGIDLPTFGALETFEQVMDSLAALATEAHDFKTVIVDSLDKLEPLVWAATCTQNNWESIETPGYGRGYVEADKAWGRFFNTLNYLRNEVGMSVVLIGHSTVAQFDDPTAASYSRYDIRLHKRALAMVQDTVDAILFVNVDPSVKEEGQGFNKEAKAKGGSMRFIYCEGRASVTAKNRYEMPDRILYQKGQGYAALAPYFPAMKEA